MAQLKSGSTENGVEILKKDLSNVSSSLSSSVKAALKGDTGTSGTSGSNGINKTYAYNDSTLVLTDGGTISYSLSGTTLNITT